MGMRASMAGACISVDTLPLAGRDQGWGAIGPNDQTGPHPLLASPSRGGTLRWMGELWENLDIPAPIPILPSSAALTGRYPMDFTLNDCLARIAPLESAHACLRYPARPQLFDAR